MYTMYANASNNTPSYTHVSSYMGWGEPTRTLVPWRQGFRHPTRNECMGWFALISIHGMKSPTPKQDSNFNVNTSQSPHLDPRALARFPCSPL